MTGTALADVHREEAGAFAAAWGLELRRYDLNEYHRIQPGCRIWRRRVGVVDSSLAILWFLSHLPPEELIAMLIFLALLSAVYLMMNFWRRKHGWQID